MEDLKNKLDLITPYSSVEELQDVVSSYINLRKGVDVSVNIYKGVERNPFGLSSQVTKLHNAVSFIQSWVLENK